MSDKRIHCKDCIYYNAPVEMCMRAGGDKSPARPTDYCEYGKEKEVFPPKKVVELIMKHIHETESGAKMDEKEQTL